MPSSSFEPPKAICDLGMVSLNIGSGRDSWGDIRVDLLKSQTGIPNDPNLIGSALYLPIRDSAIQQIRCWHVIEHLIDWRRLLNEIARVSTKDVNIQLRFPIDDGFKRYFLINWSRLDFRLMRHAYLTRKNRAHVWVIDPEIVSRHLTEAGFRVIAKRNRAGFFAGWLGYGRKGKIMRRLLQWSPRLDIEWELDCAKI